MTKTERLMREIASRLVELANQEIARTAPKGKGAGHFRTVAEIRAAVGRHEVEIRELRSDVTSVADMVADLDGKRRRRGHT